MSKTPWLDEMQSRIGIEEVSGKAANAEILSWFAAIGHEEITDDATSWCAVTVGSALKTCGYPTTPRAVNMLARSYLTYGVACEPKEGALAIWPRGKSTWQGHINIVEKVRVVGGVTEVQCIGGNQSGPRGDAVTRAKWRDASEALAFRWPVAATVKDLRKAGSSEIKQADTLETGAVTTIATGATAAIVNQAVEAAPDPWVPVSIIPDGATEQIGAMQYFMEAINGLANVALKNPWLAGAAIAGLAGLYLARKWKTSRLLRHVLGLPISAEAQPSGGAHA